MLLVNTLGTFFEPAVKGTGYKLYGNSAVKMRKDDDVEAEFEVQGFQCCFEIKRYELIAGCTCSKAAGGELCEHIWAVITWLEKYGCLFRYSLTYASEVRLDVEHFGLETDDVEIPLEDQTQEFVYVIKLNKASADRNAIMRMVKSEDGTLVSRSNLNAVEYNETSVKRIGDSLDNLINPYFENSADSIMSDLPLFSSVSDDEKVLLSSIDFPKVLNELQNSERFVIKYGSQEPAPAYVDQGESFLPKAVVAESNGGYFVNCLFERDGDSIAGDEVNLLLNHGCLLKGNTWYRFELDTPALAQFIKRFQEKPRLDGANLGHCLNRLSLTDFHAAICFHNECSLTEIENPATPVLELKEHTIWLPEDRLAARIFMDYNGQEFSLSDDGGVVVDMAAKTWFKRDKAREKACYEWFYHLSQSGKDSLTGNNYLRNSGLDSVLKEMLKEGWNLKWGNEAIMLPDSISLDMDVVEGKKKQIFAKGSIAYGTQTVAIGDAFASWRAGTMFVPLKSGGFGIQPSDWFSKNRLALEAGKYTKSKGTFTFDQRTVGVVNSLAESVESVEFSLDYKALAEKVGQSFEQNVIVPESFVGELRDYQKDGLTWMLYMRHLGFGGILADDMGLGKTVQTLAYIEKVRTEELPADPILIIVPRSLLSNWEQEALSFTPDLKLHVHHGPSRSSDVTDLQGYDVVVTTYDTMRSDSALLSQVTFDTCIIDEAQAIKNRNTQRYRAIKKLNARVRLALTGTPVENHLRDVANILEFINPGILKESRILSGILDEQEPTLDQLHLFSRAVSPFMLRRVKEVVEKDLPPKTINQVFCEFSPEHRKVYDQLRQELKREMKGKVDEFGWSKSKIYAFEYLLRLRQCACHPQLGNAIGKGVASSKFEVLFDLLEDVLESGHKALIFSQFTSLLDFLKKDLEQRDIAYEYLDGQTPNRGEVVDRFQNDPSVPLFLLSLKAGGVGLNLTSADYVFLLDPWWNPAIEEQAIDRTHRIGQDKSVFVYKLVGKDTIEDHVLALQQSKQGMADMIAMQAKSMMEQLTDKDMDVLFS